MIAIPSSAPTTFAYALGSVNELWPSRSVPRATRMRGAVCTVTIDPLSRILSRNLLRTSARPRTCLPLHRFLVACPFSGGTFVCSYGHGGCEKNGEGGDKGNHVCATSLSLSTLRVVSGQRWGERTGPLRPRMLTVSGEVRVVVPTHARILAGRGLCSTPKRIRRLLPLKCASYITRWHCLKRPECRPQASIDPLKTRTAVTVSISIYSYLIISYLQCLWSMAQA